MKTETFNPKPDVVITIPWDEAVRMRDQLGQLTILTNRNVHDGVLTGVPLLTKLHEQLSGVIRVN